MNNIYSTLNPPQQEAVYHTEGPLLILAERVRERRGVLTHRIAYLIDEKGDKIPGISWLSLSQIKQPVK